MPLSLWVWRGHFFKSLVMILQFFKQHNYGTRVIRAGDVIEVPDKQAVYMIRMGIAQSVDYGEEEKVEIIPVKEKVEYKPVKEKVERKPRKKKK